jgi:hypothetical protein
MKPEYPEKTSDLLQADRGLDEPDCIGEGTEISDRTKETIAGLQKNITRIITLSNEDLQVLFFMSPNRLIQ